MTSQGMKALANKRGRLLAGAVLLAWWALLGGVWMLLVDTVSIAEIASAVAAALVAVLATRLVFASGTAPMRARARLLPALGRQLARVPLDLWLLLLALARALAGRPRPGRFHELALELPSDEWGDGRRAGIELLGSFAPNTIVLGVDGRRVIVHQLVARHAEREGVVEIGS